MSTTPEWVKSTYSDNQNANCVEWAPRTAAATGLVPIRDSKDPSGPALLFPIPAWSAFVTAVAAGDLPV